MKQAFIFLLSILCCTANAQVETEKDSSKSLREVIIKAYENNRKLIDVAASISVINNAALTRFNNTSILPALNNSPGVRMEERSPGSYRLNIRGSSLRSPFGVRNIKVYFNDIPYTDPGGNTYLNQLGFYNVQSLEIIKGPGSSLYGAGTGGVVLIRSDVDEFQPGVSLDYSLGSFNLNNFNVNIRSGNADHQNTTNYQHQASDGYRDHTNMRRDVITFDVNVTSHEKSKLTANFFYSDLYYQTPGALVKSEYDQNAKAARPAVGINPSADKAQAAIYQKTFLAGFSYDEKFNEHFNNITSVYGAYSQMRNPSFRNYGRTTEPHFGTRTVFNFSKKINNALLNLSAGGEAQQSYNTQRIYKNKNGEPDSLQTDDEIYYKQAFAFAQAILELQKGWIITAGASFNSLGLTFRRLSTAPSAQLKRNFNNEVTPRFSLLKKINKAISVYGSIGRGFSAPQTAEILPSTNIFNTTLQAESGLDYEVGARGSLLKTKLYFDVNAFFFHLKNAIVQRRDASGADYYDNAGSTRQNGLETYLSYLLTDDEHYFFNHVKIWTSYTWNDFHYNDFKQVSTDFSGKQLPGIPPQIVAAGLDLNTKAGMYANINYYYADKIALNDANTDYASSYNLASVRLGYRTSLSKKTALEIFAGGENLFDEKYSLGNDINAAGGRYYNAAAGRNYFAGISFKFNSR